MVWDGDECEIGLDIRIEVIKPIFNKNNSIINQNKMNKKMILPLISLALLIGAILLTIYFKNIEKGIERQQSETQNKAIDQQEDNLKMDKITN